MCFRIKFLLYVYGAIVVRANDKLEKDIYSISLYIGYQGWVDDILLFLSSFIEMV